MDIREADDEDLLDALQDRGFDKVLINALKDKSIEVKPIDKFSDTQLNNEITRRRHEAEKRYDALLNEQQEKEAEALEQHLSDEAKHYEEMMAQGLV